MSVLHRLARSITAVFRRRQQEAELDAELEEFLQASIDAKLAAGMPKVVAERAARLELGSRAAVKDWVRDVGWETRLESCWQDLRYAARALRRNPAFAGAGIATLALGIGASTAIFSVAYGVVIRPLPFPDPDRLVRLYEARPSEQQLEHEVSVGAFHAWREGAPSIESSAMFAKPSTRFLTDRDGTPLAIMSVSPTLFGVLGVTPHLGPGFKPERDYTRYNADDEGVLSYAAWQRLFGGRPDVVGQQLEFSGVGDNDLVRIVGVMPEGFTFAEPADMWKPTLLVEAPGSRVMRQWRYDRAVARLRPGTSIEQVRAELSAISARLGLQFPDTNAGWSASVESLQDAIVGRFRRAAWLLLAAVGVMLLIACVNVGGLLASRAVARERETAVRVALGAGSWRLLRLWLAEATLLSAVGAATGVLLAWSGVHALRTAAPPGVPRLDAISLDLPVFLIAGASTLLALFTSAMAPLAVARRRDLTNGLRAGAPGSGDTPGRQTARAALVVAQCAGAAALVVLAVLLTRSFNNLLAVDLGWDAEGVLSLKASPPIPRDLRRPWARYVEWSDRLTERLNSVPGIEGAAITTQIPLSADTYPASVARGRGKGGSDDRRWPSVQHNVSNGYFQTMGIALVSGRLFDDSDRFSPTQLVDSAVRPPYGSAVITESLARTLWPGTPAVGQALWLPAIDNVGWRQVVGVVEDIDFHAVAEVPIHHVFVPWTQLPTGNPRLVVKGTGTGAALAPVVRAVLQEVDPGTHVDQVIPLDALVGRATAQSRFTSRLVGLFGALALILAGVGIHGTLAYLVRARARDMGIRVTLGASRRDILVRTLSNGLAPAIVGFLLGTAAAAALARAFGALLFDVSPLDARSLAVGGVTLLLVALAAASGPARSAARVDPLVALRTE